MPSTYKTPGVYIEEIAKFPPSVAQVETAVPAFIGYTEKAEKNGESLINKPTKIYSLLDFETYFGLSYSYQSSDIKIITEKASSNNSYAVTDVSFTNNKNFRLYNSIRMFFDNGGGNCYINSVNTFDKADFLSGNLNPNEISAGLDAIAKYDEPTILVFPDAVQMKDIDFSALQQKAIKQCADLQDRVVVLDLKENLLSKSWDDAVADFRTNIGINDLKYGIAYTPWLLDSHPVAIDFSLIDGRVFEADGATTVLLENVTSKPEINNLVTTVRNAHADIGTVAASVINLSNGLNSIQDNYYTLRNVVTSADNATVAAEFKKLVDFVYSLAMIFPAFYTTTFVSQNLKNDLDSFAKDQVSGLKLYVTNLIAFEKNLDVSDLTKGANDYTSYDGVSAATPNSWLITNVSDIQASAPNPPYGGGATKTAALAALTDLDIYFFGLQNVLFKVQAAADQREKLAQSVLYLLHPIISNIVTALQQAFSVLPPSGAVCGIYAKVDNDRGVWKAPANVSINSVIGPTVMITNDMQDSLNVDVEAGKSINAIRAFTGKGTLVWGARTLAGNDNEWRYVSVRRFFNMVEESVKKASSQFVFEPNDAGTWVKVKAMIENFLTTLWRQGALAGAKPEHAFYVKLGLGETMTSLDILEGRMIVEIGMAAVRPAEFIILRFSHKMQES